jgi:hypothetical protein
VAFYQKSMLGSFNLSGNRHFFGVNIFKFIILTPGAGAFYQKSMLRLIIIVSSLYVHTWVALI